MEVRLQNALHRILSHSSKKALPSALPIMDGYVRWAFAQCLDKSDWPPLLSTERHLPFLSQGWLSF
jgi:hypothetical protein